MCGKVQRRDPQMATFEHFQVPRDDCGVRRDGWGARPDGWGTRPDGWGTRPDGWGIRPDGWGTRPDGWGTRPDHRDATRRGRQDGPGELGTFNSRSLGAISERP